MTCDQKDSGQYFLSQWLQHLQTILCCLVPLCIDTMSTTISAPARRICWCPPSGTQHMEPAVDLESCSCHKISFLPFSTNLSLVKGKVIGRLIWGVWWVQDNIHASIGRKCPQRWSKESRTIMVEKLISSTPLLWSLSPHSPICRKMSTQTGQTSLCSVCFAHRRMS